MKKIYALSSAMLFAAAASAQAQEVTPTPLDFSAFTDAIDVSTVVTAIMAVGVIMIGPRLAVYGVNMFRRMIR